MDLQAEIIRKYNSGLALNHIVHYVQYSGAKKSTLKQARDTTERCIVAYLLRQKGVQGETPCIQQSGIA